MKQSETSRVHVPSPRGVLALLVLPSSNRFAVHAAALGRNESTHRLHYFDHDPNAPRLNKIQSHKRQRKQTQTHEYDEDLEIQALNVFGLHVTPTVHVHVPYHPSQGEFTLIYFCDMNCLHEVSQDFCKSGGMPAIHITKVDEGKISLTWMIRYAHMYCRSYV